MLKQDEEKEENKEDLGNNWSYGYEGKEKYIDQVVSKGLNDEKRKTETTLKAIHKRKSAKKSRVKSKMNSAIKEVQGCMALGIPSFFKDLVENMNLHTVSVEPSQQERVFDFLDSLSRTQLALVFFGMCKTPEQIDFVKRVILSKKFVSILFQTFEIENLSVSPPRNRPQTR